MKKTLTAVLKKELHAEETKIANAKAQADKIRAAMSALNGSGARQLGVYKRSPETIAKMRASAKARWGKRKSK